MKKYASAAAILFSVMIFSCKKSASTSIQGKWNVVSDSTIITGPSVSYTIYNGVPGDYFVFTADNVLYTKEASSYDTANYQLTSANTIILPDIGYSVNGVTEPSSIYLSGNQMKIVANPPGNIVPPGHQYQRIINLKR